MGEQEQEQVGGRWVQVGGRWVAGVEPAEELAGVADAARSQAAGLLGTAQKSASVLLNVCLNPLGFRLGNTNAVSNMQKM